MSFMKKLYDKGLPQDLKSKYERGELILITPPCFFCTKFKEGEFSNQKLGRTGYTCEGGVAVSSPRSWDFCDKHELDEDYLIAGEDVKTLHQIMTESTIGKHKVNASMLCNCEECTKPVNGD